MDGGGKAFLVDNGIEVEVMDGEEAQMAAALITDFWERMKVEPKTPHHVLMHSRQVYFTELNQRSPGHPFVSRCIKTEQNWVDNL